MVVIGATALGLTGCSTTRQTQPSRTATEQLLISRAADEAAARVALPIPKGAAVFVDASQLAGTDGKYAAGALRTRLLQLGARLVQERKAADIVVEIRSGALSIDESQTLLGTPRVGIPIPLAGTFTIPEIAFFKHRERKGVAKFVATAYGAKRGEYIGTSKAQFGYAHKKKWVVLLLISWASDDLIPNEKGDARR